MKEGVVCLKHLTNGLFVAVYTSGLVRVVRISDGRIIAEGSVFSEKSQAGSRVIDGRIAFVSLPSHSSIEDGVCKSLSICVASTQEALLQSFQHCHKAFSATIFTLRFKNISGMMNGGVEDLGTDA